MKKKVLIIATAAHEGGALTILTQFLDSIPELEKENYIIFASPKLKESIILSKFEAYFFDSSSWFKRIAFDLYKYKSLINKLNLKVCGCINFQNIASRLGNIRQVVYLHQSLPFYSYKWKLLDKTEYKFFLISKFYLKFIKANLSFATFYIVQSPWLKDALADKISISKDKIFCFRPGIVNINTQSAIINHSSKKLIYPALDYSYKNHKVIVKALFELKRQGLINKEVKIYFTCEPFSWLSDDDKRMLEDILIFTGKLSFEELHEIYKLTDCLLFPSKVESFGLPLIEAAVMGKYIIASDLNYAHDVLSDYKECKFVNPDSPIEWASAINEYSHFDDVRMNRENAFIYKDQWPDFLSFINKVCFANT